MLDSVVFVHQDESLWPLGGTRGLNKLLDGVLALPKNDNAPAAQHTSHVDTTASATVSKAWELPDVAMAAARGRAAEEDRPAKVARTKKEATR